MSVISNYMLQLYIYVYTYIGFIGFGYSLVFYPDSNIKEIIKRIYGTTLTSLSLYVMLPKLFQISSETFNYHKRNIMIAITSGSLLAIGSYLFNNKDNNHHFGNNNYNKMKKIKLKMLLLQCLGGSSLIIGFYLWFPSIFRLLWDEINDDLISQQYALHNNNQPQPHHNHHSHNDHHTQHHQLINSKIKLRGGCIAFINGFLYGLAYDYFNFDNYNNIYYNISNKDTDMKNEVEVDKHNDHQSLSPSSMSSSATAIIDTLQKPLGAGLFAVGTYIFVPPYLRLLFEYVFT